MKPARGEELDVASLKERITECQQGKQELIDYLQGLKEKWLEREISYAEYELEINEPKNGKTIQEWFDYYDNYIAECSERIKEESKKSVKSKAVKIAGLFVLLGLVLTILGFLLSDQVIVFLSPPLKNYTDVLEIVTNESLDHIWDIENPGDLESVKISGLILGEGNVRILLEDQLILDSENLVFTSGGITGRVTGFQIFNSTENETGGGDENGTVVLPGQENATETNESLPPETNESLGNVTLPGNESEGNVTLPEENATLPGNESGDNATIEVLMKEFLKYCEETCSNVGLNQDSYTLKIQIVGEAEFHLDEIGYEIISEEETVPPGQIRKEENNIKRGKRVKVSGPDDLVDVPVSSDIPETWNIRDSNSLRVYWVEEDRDISFVASDSDGNGIINLIEWNVPHLSDQTFEIIVITSAEHLDSNRDFVSDIFEEVREQDGLWSEEISNGDYVRVTFEQKLDSTRDITIWPRVVTGNPRIEVFEGEGSDLIAEFVNLIEDEYNKILLSDLVGGQDVFDLRVIGGSVEFDHIIDPTIVGFFDPTTDGPGILGNWQTPNGAYTSNDGSEASGRDGRDQEWHGFGFSIPPGATIEGIEVRTEARNRDEVDIFSVRVELLDSLGNVVGDFKNFIISSTTEVVTILGDSSDLWNSGLTASEINSPNFGVRLTATGPGGRSRVLLDNVDIRITYNSPPTIISIDPVPPVTLLAGTTRDVTVTFTAEDLDGAGDLDSPTASVSFSKAGETTRTSIPVTGCSAAAPIGDRITYTCTVTMQYYDDAGTAGLDGWDVSASVDDISGLTASQTDTNVLTVNPLEDIILSTDLIDFGTVIPGTKVDSLADTTVQNDGNYEGTLKVTARNLVGPPTLDASNFYAGEPGVGDVCAGGNQLQDGVLVDIVSTSLPRGPVTNTEDISWCLDTPVGLPPGDYTATGGNQWVISLSLAAFALRKKKKKKLKKKIKDERLLKALALMSDELKEKYSLSKRETIKLIVGELGKKYKVSDREVIESLARRKEEEIPLSIFSKKLGGLEALCKYMKENLRMSYHEIALELNRDDRTIWTAYNKAKDKKVRARARESSIIVPLEIFKNRKLTVLEAVIIYLRKQKIKYKEIASLLERDVRNVQTINSRAVKKNG